MITRAFLKIGKRKELGALPSVMKDQVHSENDGKHCERICVFEKHLSNPET